MQPEASAGCPVWGPRATVYNPDQRANSPDSTLCIPPESRTASRWAGRWRRRIVARSRFQTRSATGHTVVAARSGIKPIPFGVGERLDGLVLTGRALRIGDRRERRGDDKRSGGGDDGLRK